MSVDNIIAKIMADAETKAAETKMHSEQRAAEVKKRLIQQATEKVEEILAQSEEDVEEIQRRQTLIAELENRKSLLAVRRQVLDEAFAQAESKLLQLPQEQWEALLTKYIMTGCETGDELLCVPENDKEKYQSYFLEKLNKQLKEKGRKGNLALTDKPANFSGGVLIIGKDSDYDASFSAILKKVRVENEKQAADILFATEV